jgi:eukaryotic-like serine/threonine-protein kinase
MAEEPPKVKPAGAAVMPPPRPGEKKLGPSPRPAATPPPGSTPRASSDAIRTPSPAEAVKPSHTAHDRGLEVRMAIGHAATAPHADGELLEIDPGMRLRQYELIRELGRGGMGQVFLARDVKLARRVAIKFLATQSRELTERFLREARTTAAVNHENIVVIHEVDEHAGMPHMVLEYLEGTSLRELMNGRAYAPGRVVEMILPVVRAVARAHAAGIVHRDLKPENILVTLEGAIKVLDFGIAKALVDPEAPQHKATPADLEHATANALTGKSAIIGTPQYMSPEQFGLDSVDHRSDLWAIGIIMFELLTGKHPLTPYTITSLLISASALDQPMPAIGSVVHDLPERLERIVDRCLAKKKSDRLPDAKTLLAELEALAPGRYGRKLTDDESPYPGLAAFQEDDADRFFGRSRDVARMQTRLREHALLAIAGPSGVGKSSFVRAGIVPALKRTGEAWETYILRPGRQPMASLAGVLAPLISSSSGEGTRNTNPNALTDYEKLITRLTAEPGYLGQLLRERAARKNARILLFVDQFEELYTLVPDEAQRRAFTACLAGAADDASSPVRIISSIRSDFLDRVAEDRTFLDELMRGLIFLQPLGRPELREALSRPLDAHGYRYESEELIEQMLDELAAVPGALPLLQYAGARLWDARDRKNKVLTASAHAAMGGIAGALATHADQFLAGLPADSHRLVRAIFQRLVTPERTRAIAELDDLETLSDAASVRRIIDQLVTARLLVVQIHGETGGASVEIVHESLLDAWPTLRRWLDEDQDDAAFLAQLAAAAKQWEAKGRAQGLVWRGEAMAEAQRWAKTRARRLPDRDQAYLDAVLALARRTRRVRMAALVGAFAVLTAIAGGASFAYARVRAANQVAEHQRAVAEKALADKIAEETARHQAEDERTAALASLLTEEQLRKAAEEGLLTAEQVAQIAEIQKRVAEKKRVQAEGKLATSEQQRAQLAEQLKKSEEEKRAAEAAAQQKSAEAQLSREQLIDKNKELEAALAAAKTAREKAEALRVEADRANGKLEEVVKAKQAEIERLEKERKKITTSENLK